MCDNGQYTYVYYETDNPIKNVNQKEFMQKTEQGNTSVSSKDFVDSTDSNNNRIKIVTILGLIWTIFSKL